MSASVPSRERLLSVITDWSATVPSDCFEDFFIFGSLLSDETTPFLDDRSDVDMVAVLSLHATNPLLRQAALTRFLPHKIRLENLVRASLNRIDATEQIVSILAVCQTEINYDIAKAESPDFFAPRSGNQFIRLRGGTKVAFSPTAQAKLLPSSHAQMLVAAVVQVQKFRNQYLAINSNGRPRVIDFADESDPLPKDLMRWASVVAWSGPDKSPLPEVNAFDLNVGVSIVERWVTDLARNDAEYASILSLILRRRGRGRQITLSASVQLALWEILYEKAIHELATALSGSAPVPSGLVAFPIQPDGDSQSPTATSSPIRHDQLGDWILYSGKIRLSDLEGIGSYLAIDHARKTGEGHIALDGADLILNRTNTQGSYLIQLLTYRTPSGAKSEIPAALLVGQGKALHFTCQVKSNAKCRLKIAAVDTSTRQVVDYRFFEVPVGHDIFVDTLFRLQPKGDIRVQIHQFECVEPATLRLSDIAVSIINEA